MSTDISGFTAQVKRVKEAATAAGKQTTRSWAHSSIKAMAQISPRDTNHYYNGWVEANNQLKGVAKLPRLPIVASKYAASVEARLSKQIAKVRTKLEDARKWLEFWQGIVAKRYDAKGRKGKWRDDAVAKRSRAMSAVKKLTKALDKAIEQKNLYLASGDTLIVIGGKKLKKGGVIGKSNLATVRMGGGGLGEIAEREIDGAFFVTASNKNAHATIVETRHRVVARGNAMAGTSGIATMNKGVQNAIAKAGDGQRAAAA